MGNMLGGLEVIQSIPRRCNCAPIAHKLLKRRNDQGWIYFCPVTRVGYIQFHNTGIIMQGVFTDGLVHRGPRHA